MGKIKKNIEITFIIYIECNRKSEQKQLKQSKISIKFPDKEEFNNIFKENVMLRNKRDDYIEDNDELKRYNLIK